MAAVSVSPDLLFGGVPAHVPLPDGVERDAYWSAALLVLGGFGPHAERVWSHVNARGIAFAAMADQPWSSGELLAGAVARALFTGNTFDESLTDLAFRLDDRFWNRLIQALALLRTRR